MYDKTFHLPFVGQVPNGQADNTAFVRFPCPVVFFGYAMTLANWLMNCSAMLIWISWHPIRIV